MKIKQRILIDRAHLSQFESELESLCKRIFAPYCDVDLTLTKIDRITILKYEGTNLQNIEITIKSLGRIHATKQSGNSR